MALHFFTFQSGHILIRHRGKMQRFKQTFTFQSGHILIGVCGHELRSRKSFTFQSGHILMEYLRLEFKED